MTIHGRWLAVLGPGLPVGGVRLDTEPGTRAVRSLAVEADVRSTVVTVRDQLGIPGEPTDEPTLRLAGRSKLTCEVRKP